MSLEKAALVEGRTTHQDRIARYFAVGIANSAPFSMLSGQRCMIDFCFV
jgi:hypothetical protein